MLNFSKSTKFKRNHRIVRTTGASASKIGMMPRNSEAAPTTRRKFGKSAACGICIRNNHRSDYRVSFIFASHYGRAEVTRRMAIHRGDGDPLGNSGSGPVRRNSPRRFAWGPVQSAPLLPARRPTRRRIPLSSASRYRRALRSSWIITAP